MAEKLETIPAEATIDNLTITNDDNGADFVDPWNVASSSDTGVDYEKLISTIQPDSITDNWMKMSLIIGFRIISRTFR